MESTSGPDPDDSPRSQPPVARYALIIGGLIVVGILATVYGARHQNPMPNPASSHQTDGGTGR